MNSQKRNKKPVLPETLDKWTFTGIFSRIEGEPLKSQRAVQILELLSRMGQLPPHSEWSRADRAEAAAIQAGLGKHLGGFRWGRRVSITSDGLQVFLVAADAADDGWEHKAVSDLLELVPDNLWRLRRCAYKNCGRWFYAMKSDHICCPGWTGRQCRQKHYLSDPENRKKHNKAVKDYDERERRKDQKAKERLKGSNRGMRR